MKQAAGTFARVPFLAGAAAGPVPVRDAMPRAPKLRNGTGSARLTGFAETGAETTARAA